MTTSTREDDAPGSESDPPGSILPTNRVEALTDGIVAIAATLLVFEIKQPSVHGGLGTALLREWPSYATYAVSFVTIAIIWVNHHALMNFVARTDRTFLFLNTFLLMGLCAIPFPTGLLGRYLQTGYDQQPAAVAYAVVMLFTAGMFPLLWIYLARNPHLLKDRRHAALITGGAIRRSLVGPAVYALALLVAFVSAQAAISIDALIALYFVRPFPHARGTTTTGGET